MSDALQPQPRQSGSIYGLSFWLTFLSNLVLVTANTMTVRFAEFVKMLGGTEEITGQIIGIGLAGSLIWRLFLGQMIDRFGIRATWVGSTLCYVLAAILMAVCESLGPLLVIARILYAIGIASMFTVALLHVQWKVPVNRRTEIVATYGIGGFLGLIVGAILGDALFQTVPEGHFLYTVLFGSVAVFGLMHGVIGFWLTRKEIHVRPQQTPAIFRLVKYWPTSLGVVALLLGLVLTVTTIFTSRYAQSLGIPNLKAFYITYAMSACLMRIFSRRWSRTQSRHVLMIYGMGVFVSAHALMLCVSRDWHFIGPAILYGVGHAVMFPCLVSLGARSFPDEYRGTAATISIGVIDLGTAITAPFCGWIIDNYGFYEMLIVSTLITLAGTIIYGLKAWWLVDEDVEVQKKSVETSDVKRPPTRLFQTAVVEKPSPHHTSL